tara:strand:+ start:1852 stop:2283 length:432 start_codon:yes stop_codon:yes gene_type:complete
MRKINKIIIHCSATPQGRDVDIETIRGWHVDERGWSDIGYHYVIELDGAIKKGRPVSIQGAHTKGHNKNSIGICYVGGTEKDDIKIPKDTRTDAQKDSLTKLLLELKVDYCEAVIYGHRDFASKACPSFDATEEYKYISDYYE